MPRGIKFVKFLRHSKRDRSIRTYRKVVLPKMTRIFFINPKRPGLFGHLDPRGGAAAAHFRERRLELPNFHFCPQTVFHMKAGIFS